MGKTVLIGDDFSYGETQTYGRAIGNRRILRALAHCASVDRILLPGALPQSIDDELLARKLESLPSAESVSKVLEAGEVASIFCSDCVAKYPAWVELRNQLNVAVAVFGITHSLSYQRFTASFFHLLTTGARPYDAILCSSISGRDVIERLLDSVQENLQEDRGKPDLRLFPHPVEGPGIAMTEPQPKWNDSDFHIAYLGRLDWRNKADLLPLFEVLRMLPKHARLTIAGLIDDQRYVELLQEKAAGLPIDFWFDLSESEKWELLKNAHVLLSPSDNYQETYGLSILEAMSVGCVPVISDFDGYRDLVSHGETGLLFKTVGAPMPKALRAMQGIVDEIVYHGWWAGGLSYDLDNVASLLRGLVEDENKWSTLSQNAFVDAKRYDIENSSQRLESVLFRDLDTNFDSSSDYSPFNWCPKDIFEKHPCAFWERQSVRVTEAGKDFLKNPRILDQMRILGGAVSPKNVHTCLRRLDDDGTVALYLWEGGEALTLSLCLKNGLIFLV